MGKAAVAVCLVTLGESTSTPLNGGSSERKHCPYFRCHLCFCMPCEDQLLIKVSLSYAVPHIKPCKGQKTQVSVQGGGPGPSSAFSRNGPTRQCSLWLTAQGCSPSSALQFQALAQQLHTSQKSKPRASARQIHGAGKGCCAASPMQNSALVGVSENCNCSQHPHFILYYRIAARVVKSLCREQQQGDRRPLTWLTKPLILGDMHVMGVASQGLHQDFGENEDDRYMSLYPVI